MSEQNEQSQLIKQRLPAPQPNDVAIFLDLDNLVIGAKQAGMVFDINLVLDCIKEVTNGRIVLRRSYGDWRQSQQLMKELASAGFTTQSTIRLNNFSKNLADMQIVVDTMDTLIDGHTYSTYVLMTGDRDFTPLVQSLRKRGKHVIGLGVRNTVSQSFVDLCDQYIYYEDIVPQQALTDADVEVLLSEAVDSLLKDEKRVRASVIKQHMSEASNGAFDQSKYAEGGFRKFLKKYPQIVEIQQVDTTLYVRKPKQVQAEKPLYLRYRTALKKNKLRIIPTEQRFVILKGIISALDEKPQIGWRELIDALAERYAAEGKEISKNMINALLLLARQADVVHTLKGKSLSTAPVTLYLTGSKVFQEAVMRCDAVYLQAILELPEPFDMEEAALALYYNTGHVPYLKQVLARFGKIEG